MKRVLLCLLAVASVSAAAQVDHFEVASVRPNGHRDALPLIPIAGGGRVLAPNSTLRDLIRAAYRLDDNQIVGGPDWLNRDRFAVEATPSDPSATPEQLQRMLVTLLGERFAPKTRFEKHELARAL